MILLALVAVIHIELCGVLGDILNSTQFLGNGSYLGQLPSVGKPCAPESSSDCLFKLDHLLTHHQVYFECRNQECICSTPTPSPPQRSREILDNWSLAWDAELQNCKVTEFGPCGETNGLQIDCYPGFLCIQSRCRSPRSLGKAPLGSSCLDDVDCVHGLACSTSNKKNESSSVSSVTGGKRCLSPTTAPRSIHRPMPKRQKIFINTTTGAGTTVVTPSPKSGSPRRESTVLTVVQTPEIPTKSLNKSVSSPVNILSNSDDSVNGDDVRTTFIRKISKNDGSVASARLSFSILSFQIIVTFSWF